ncbi:hypothetical protein EVJ58_g9459 [Rhodofomes roseus]|uniref:Septin-type G domain-containing protein n=1 Tax=Rhodofomes roseus TaxID=34475 RepID=A0A4Y9XTG5_9APHY|nr:hypothetical protein EVJ58_g9459 [Rhodofomes roseus]
MDAVDHRARPDQLVHDDGPYGQVMDEQAGLRPSRPTTAGDADTDLPGYTLMVAGRRSGKTSFLRLVLDTSFVARSVSHDQLVSVAKFVQGCSGHTSHVRSASVNVDLAPAEGEDSQEFTLTLVDTPSLDFVDDAASQRVVTDILRYVDARFAESIDDERMAQRGDHHVHLCIYFLDPDTIVPPSVPAPPVPLVTRSRAGSMSEVEPVILEPPVTNNPLLCRPALPAADIATIRRLSSRVNVLPVVGRADILTNERLAAVKTAVRRDLADAGIGFGIFDMDTFPGYPQYTRRDSSENIPPKLENGYGSHINGASSSATSPPSPPMSPPSFLRLPYAVISPDIYSHSDGVARPAPSRHELTLQYTPLQQFPNHKQQTFAKIVPGKFIRSFRWGFLDVMDTTHSRKLKCDGGRPACSQCFKRSNPCDYTASQKGRGGRKARKQFGGSESEGESMEDQSMDMDNVSQSPEVSVTSHPHSHSQPTSRRNSNVGMLLGETLPPLSSAIERRDESASSTTLAPIQQATTSLRNVTLTDARPELPPIATLSAPPSSASKSLPQEDPPSIGSLKSEDGQMTARRRTSARGDWENARDQSWLEDRGLQRLQSVSRYLDSAQDQVRRGASSVWQLFAALAAVQLRQRPGHEQGARSGGGGDARPVRLDVVALVAVRARAVQHVERDDARHRYGRWWPVRWRSPGEENADGSRVCARRCDGGLV